MSSSSVPRIQVFRPTMEEFKDFSKYIEKMESMGAHKAGLAKIIPPEGWCPRKGGYDDIDLVIPAPISQMVRGSQGLYNQYNVQQKSMTVKEFKKLAESEKFRTPPHFDYEDLERQYWKNIAYSPPLYGADVSGSLYDDGVEEFNIQHLNTILDMVKEDYEIQIEGVNTAYLYFGMWKTTFAWHTEDMDLYSINYLHFGAPKSWYVVPPEHGRRLERLAANFFHTSFGECPAFLRHKMTIISPKILKKYSIPCNKITQEPGEFMITFPFGYHSGFNHGYNCAESTNFALPRWIEYGKRAQSCTCRNDCVKICMDMFVRRFQPTRYDLWKVGKDYGTHPEDPSRHYAAPAPKKLELALAAQREERKKAKAQKIKRHPVSKLETNKKYQLESIPKDDAEDNDTKETEIYDVNEIEESSHVAGETSDVCSPMKMEEISSDLEHINTSSNKSSVIAELKNEKSNVETSADDSKTEAETKVNISGSKKRCVGKKSKSTSRRKNLNPIKCDVNVATDDTLDESPATLPLKKCARKPATKRSLSERENGSITFASSEQHLDIVEPEPAESQQTDIPAFKKMKFFKQISKPVLLKQPEGNVSISPSNAQGTSNANESSSSSFTAENEVGAIKNDLLTKYPSLRQAISNGTLAVTCVNPVSFQLPSRSQNLNVVNIGVMNTPHGQKLQQSTAAGDAVLISSFQSTPVTCVSTHKTGTASILFRNWHTPGSTWKCEHTQGLKVRFVHPKQITTNILPNETNNETTSVTASTSSLTLPASNSTSTYETGAAVTTELSSTSVTPPKPISEGGETKIGLESEKDKNPERKKRKRESRACSSKSVKPASEMLGNWAQPILPLWQHQDFDFEEEKKFNIHCSSIEPFCAVCIVFTPAPISTDYPRPVQTVPAVSKVKMPSFYFGNNLDNQFILDNHPLYSRDGTSPLLVCSNCKLCVHATCYGVTMLQMGPWRCARCTKNAKLAECCLCVLRGGALKPTNDGRWAHVLCAVLIPETFFEDVILKEPIDVTKLTVNRQRLKCKYCFKSIQSVSQHSGACIQCLSGKCFLPFHVTCGYVAGVIYEACDWPEPINIMCTRHAGGRRKPLKRNFTSVKVGDKVLAKHKNRRYYWVEVKHIYNQEYYSVLFEDNSTSTNTLPEDIVHRNRTTSGCPDINEKIRVKWTDGKEYNAIFKGSRTCEIYVVEFDDGTLLTQERVQIFAADETLPREVASKMSHSTERRHIDNFKQAPEGKRIRVSNWKYIDET